VCDALRWQDDGALYRCGALSAPGAVLRARLPAALHFAVPALAWSLGRLAGRWVAAGDGCDCDAQLEDAPVDIGGAIQSECAGKNRQGEDG